MRSLEKGHRKKSPKAFLRVCAIMGKHQVVEVIVWLIIMIKTVSLAKEQMQHPSTSLSIMTKTRG